VFEVAPLLGDLREMVRKAKEATPASAP